MEKDARIYVAGHRGMVGSAVLRLLEARGHINRLSRTSKELDLRDGQLVEQWFEEARTEYVIIVAAKVGGIWANNTLPAEFIYDNLAIQTNLIHQAYRQRVRKRGRSCVLSGPMQQHRLLPTSGYRRLNRNL